MSNPTRKKILYLITKSNWGGAQRYVYDLATTVDKSKYEVVVALGGEGALKDLLGHAHIRTISITSLQRDISLLKEIQFAQELAKIIKTEKPDVLHVNSSKAGGVGTLIGRLTRVPLVLFTAHGWSFNEHRPTWQKFILKLLHWITVLQAHKTIAVSKAIVSQMNWPLVSKKFIVINPGRSIGPMYNKLEAREKLCTLYPKLLPHKNKTWIITIAELHPIKRLDILIRALHKLNNKKFISVIIGDGELRNKLEEQIEKDQLNDQVFLLGAVTEAARFLKAANVFALTSDSESYGYVIHEAGLAKVPVIATNVGGIPDIISNEEEGLLVTPHDSDILANTFKNVLENSEQAKVRAETLYEKLSKRTKISMTTATEAVYELALK